MSTYNGEKFLRQQLDSIFSQEDVDIILVVRDDGSNDSTLSILEDYNITKIIKGENIGCEESFKELLYLPIEADYYAFSDQDDVWHRRKLISAINNINRYQVELSVCNLMKTDSKMNIQEPMFSVKDIKRMNYRFKSLILGNLHGCTQVWSKKLHRIIQSYKPEVTYPHDVWVNVIANMVFATYIDSTCYINYRLHGNNLSGKAKNSFQKLYRGFSRYIVSDHPTSDRLCQQLIEGYGKYIDIEDKKYKQLFLVANYKKNPYNKLQLLFSKIVNRTNIQRRVLHWICVLINKY